MRAKPVAPEAAQDRRADFASFAYALLELLRRWGLSGTRLARAQCGSGFDPPEA